MRCRRKCASTKCNSKEDENTVQTQTHVEAVVGATIILISNLPTFVSILHKMQHCSSLELNLANKKASGESFLHYCH